MLIGDRKHKKATCSIVLAKLTSRSSVINRIASQPSGDKEALGDRSLIVRPMLAYASSSSL
jgi:hypothetical protein